MNSLIFRHSITNRRIFRPSADEVLRLRKEFLNPGIFLYYKKPIMFVEGKCNTSGTSTAADISTRSAES